MLVLLALLSFSVAQTKPGAPPARIEAEDNDNVPDRDEALYPAEVDPAFPDAMAKATATVDEPATTEVPSPPSEEGEEHLLDWIWSGIVSVMSAIPFIPPTWWEEIVALLINWITTGLTLMIIFWQAFRRGVRDILAEIRHTPRDERETDDDEVTLLRRELRDLQELLNARFDTLAEHAPLMKGIPTSQLKAISRGLRAIQKAPHDPS